MTVRQIKQQSLIHKSSSVSQKESNQKALFTVQGLKKDIHDFQTTFHALISQLDRDESNSFTIPILKKYPGHDLEISIIKEVKKQFECDLTIVRHQQFTFRGRNVKQAMQFVEELLTKLRYLNIPTHWQDVLQVVTKGNQPKTVEITKERNLKEFKEVEDKFTNNGVFNL